METLTQSKYRGYRGCPRYFFNRYERRLVPRLQRGGLRRGTIFGSALFGVQTLAQDTGIEEAAAERGVTTRRMIRDAIEGWTEEYYSSLEITSTEEHDELMVEMVKVTEMAVAYINRYGIDQRREVIFQVPLRNPVTGGYSKSFRVGGKIDGLVVAGPKHARIIEDKFTGQIQKVMLDKLPLDAQITEYVDALASQGWTAEVEYRHTRVPGINPEKAKTYKTKPDVPAESLDDFGERLQIDIQDRPEFYFDVQRLQFSAAHLEEHRNERWRTATEILESRAMLKRLPLAQAFPRNDGRCEKYGGCEFIPLCSHREGAESLYVVGEDNPELKR